MTTAAPSGTAVAFMTHFFDQEIEERFETLARACASLSSDAHRFDCFILVEEGVDVPDRYRHLVHAFDFTRLRKRARGVIGDAVVPGNCHLRTIDLWEGLPGYAHYWFIEYDVVYAGDWSAFLSQFSDDPCDLLATRITALKDDPGWFWLDTFSTAGDGIDDDQLAYAMFAVYRISARALARVNEVCRRGWQGHHEILIPAAVVSAGLNMAEIGGRGRWTPPERIDRHYLNCAIPTHHDAFATLRWRPHVYTMPVADLLYHPRKTRSEPRGRPINRLRLFTAMNYPRASLAFAVRLALYRFRGRQQRKPTR